MKTQKKVETDEKVKSIAFGNTEASFEITMVTNPYCGHCVRMHQKLEALLNQYGDFLRMNIIYAVSNHYENDNESEKQFVEKRNLAIKLLSGIYVKYGAESTIHIYKEWYDNGKNDNDNFIKKYPVDFEEHMVDEIMSNHNNWCKMVNIDATPTLYINGSELPIWYNVEDLKYFIHQ